jgi:replication factor A1
MENYEKLVERISKSAQVTKEEIERRVEAKRAKLSGLVSREGAAQIVAAELGINFDQERMKLSEIVHGMKRLNTIAKVIKIFPIREYSKNGREGKVANMLVADDTTNVRLVLWDTNHISLVEEGKIKEGSVIEVSNAGVRNGEIHLGGFSDIKLSKENMDGVKTEKVFSSNKFKDVQQGQNLKVRAFIVDLYEPRYFDVNAETGRKLTEEEKQRGIKAEKRAVLSIVLDDGSESMRSVLFGEQIKALGLSDEDIFSLENFQGKKLSLLGEEKVFIGKVRNNMLYNRVEFSIENVEDVNVQELIKELENKAA